MFRSVGKEFLCKVRYQNPLPSVPFPPKLLPIPPTYVDPSVGSYSQARLQHYVQYRHSTLEEATPYPLMVDADYGMPIDPCLLGAFDDKAMAPQELDPQDEFLLHLPTTDARDSAEQGTDTGTPNTRKAARTLGLKRTSSGAKRTFDHSLQGQLQAIDNSFKYFDKFASEQELLQSLKHPTNSQLQAVESIPLFPDESLWPSNYALFSLDTCPEPDYAKKSQPDEHREMGEKARESMLFLSQAGTNNLGEDETWCEVFLPETNEMAEHVSAQLRESDLDDTEHRLKMVCEYDAQNDPIKQKHLMITIGEGDDGSKVAKYVQFKGKILLKRSKVPRSSRNYNTVDEFKELTNIGLQLRDLTEAEHLMRTQKLQELQAPDSTQHDSETSP
ncbi:hypothetical protein LPJ78_001470 [Coemansia sp. RSA 989]|nr:hypothetical protein LPJ68_001027 [Coemansia sp. RSA 1086]KAJ1751964.1 hypothetical protein LPJ79_001591 [Coemansia sp. RSA 1821]KAJ1866833.1 hypothetical protein LPJ78_001470 [Coemansia sp. RSA 989]KAJ1874104.1 hypothetical protein LPJ55_001807 [Coemansia sp. RSA 990]KAJ2671222.1 hypothetical protein IWW42_003484 [Coemansia sp. RSA 1085]